MYTNYDGIPTRYHGLAYSKLRINDHTLDEHLAPSSFGSFHSWAHPSASQDLGALDRLPLELLHETLLHLDIRTLFDLRNVNRRALELVDSVPQFKAIITHAPNALRGLLQIGTGRWTTIKVLHTRLCTPECEHCGDFGGYLYLMTSRRVCFLCLTQLRQYLPLRIRNAKRDFRLDKATVERLPSMRVIPGRYSPNEKLAPCTVLVDYESAFCAGIERDGSESALQKHASDTVEQNLGNSGTGTTATAHQSTSMMGRIHDFRTPPIDARSGNPLRFVAVVHMPWFNNQSKEVDWGFHCLGCKESGRAPFHYRRRFWAASFDEHIKQCGTIRNGRHVTVDPDGDSEFRILVDNISVKYITIDAGIFGLDEICFSPLLISLLPPLPPGKWIQARLGRDPLTSLARFTLAPETTLPGITSIWHPIRVNHLDVQFGEKLHSNVYEATSERFPGKVAVAKFARFPWEIPRLPTETAVYERIDGYQIGPEFLAHLTEGTRVIGFLLACVSDCRPAASQDYKACRSALAKLHALAIKHGDVNRHNFLIDSDSIMLIDFVDSSLTPDTGELQEELECLQDSLLDASDRGGQTRWAGHRP
ncbi:hypothetical protein LEMA_P053740.1 [Plenodomus lingam JN3]|uniref:F-box domain-containing protein n=1 Tax=Leptosphaeria maculans (strain JN3 / isolate v23.1.3 / race Av1-4-5-6-7-8) TaxID=985895 RepID=E4ZLI8_LEPMJ|nr:hypothetical protein LEMA_P053740.1 [Plenodomus lingam JN3]CBX92668.1 hypothetical protein LEMA_P053740.1 [Plenodomus lingam JN3]